MGPKELSNSSQDFFEYCRRGNVEKVNAWLLSKSKKSKSPLNFLRPSTPSAGWLTHLRDPLNAYTALHQAALHGHLEVAQQLVRHDPDLVNARDRRGCLPLHLAAWNGHHLVVQYLLKEEPATVDAVNNAKECPLHLAAQHGHAYVTSVLLQNHADARLRNARFETALDIAARMGKEGVCKLLIYNCPELALQSAAECTSAENRALASHVVYPLHAAARHGHIECLSILCDAGFDVNFVTDEGSALHVAALFGQLDAVRLLLKYGVDVSIRDCQGRTVLEKLHEHENQKASDLTQVIQKFIATNPQQPNVAHQDAGNVYLNFDSIPYSREVIWRTIPENSPAPHQTPPSSKRQSNGHAFHHPPSMTVERVHPNDLSWESDRASTISLSTALPSEYNNSLDKRSQNSPSASSLLSPAHSANLTRTTPEQRLMAKFPVTSPNAKGRHSTAKRFPAQFWSTPISTGSPGAPQPPPGVCTYQAPPDHDPWATPYVGLPTAAEKAAVAANTSAPAVPMSYDNLPRNALVYDNAPPPGHRRWDHQCEHPAHNHHHHSEASTIGKAGVHVPHKLRDDGTQTLPVKPGSFVRPSILKQEGFQRRSPEQPNDLKEPTIHESTSEEFESGLRNDRAASGSQCSMTTFAFSTLERSHSPHTKATYVDGEAPLAVPEELGGSTCTSLLSMSPERVPLISGRQERDCRSTTTTSDDHTIESSSTLIQDTDDADGAKTDVSVAVEEVIVIENQVSKAKMQLVSPTSTELSDATLASSCSLPMVSQISSTPPSVASPKDGNNYSFESEDNVPASETITSRELPVRLRNGRGKNRQMSGSSITGSTTSTGRWGADEGGTTSENGSHSSEWKKIDEILGAIQRDSIFARDNGGGASQVAVSIRNRNSQALTLQLTPPKESPCSSIVPPSTSNGSGSPYNGQESKAEVGKWLHSEVGIPSNRAAEVGAVLERAGFDDVRFVKGTLDKRAMTELGIDKSLQHQISSYIASRMTNEIPRIDEFDWLSDWLSALHLIDHLGAFAKSNFTYTDDLLNARLGRKDLEKMGIHPVGHVMRILSSLEAGYAKRPSHDACNSGTSTLSSATQTVGSSTVTSMAEEETARWQEQRRLLLEGCISYSAHYLGSMEISNVEGAEDCRRAMIASKGRIKQVNKVPQVILEISVGGVNVLDAETNQLTVQHEVNRIQVVCQDEIDLNCFAYIFQDGDKNFCHVYCVLTAGVAKEIIVTLGQAFNLAYLLTGP